jgi:hypothetical protein
MPVVSGDAGSPLDQPTINQHPNQMRSPASVLTFRWRFVISNGWTVRFLAITTTDKSRRTAPATTSRVVMEI